MKKQNDLQWFLIKKFIEILAVVGVVEYLLTFLVNRFVLPNVLLYFFPGVEENPLLLGSGVIFFLSAVLMLLILGALNAMFPSPLHEMVQAALEQMQKNFMHTVSAGKTNFSFYELNRGQAILLFLVAFVVVLVILTPYVLGAVCFAKITIKEFRQIQREREEEQKEFGRKRNLMLSDIAHDLRTPMTTVNGYAKALADGMVVEPEKQLEYLQAIQNKSARMNDLIHLLFEYVKLDSEGFSLDRKETDLSELLRENAALIYADFEDAGMEFEIDIPEEVVSVSVDSIQFSRVITNLLNNAMKHNESGTHIKIGMYRKNGYIYILVADSGRRIPGELAEHLFEPFTKGDASRKSGSGSGLGLSIAKKIIERNRNVKFVLAGSGEIEKLQAIVEEKGISQYFSFPGWVKKERKEKLLQEADLFFLPSYTEGMPMSILEAMGYGLPIVATNVGGIPQLVENGKNGYMVEPGKIDDFAKVILELTGNDELIYRMGKESIEKAYEKYSLEKHLEKVCKLYEKAMDE